MWEGVDAQLQGAKLQAVYHTLETHSTFAKDNGTLALPEGMHTTIRSTMRLFASTPIGGAHDLSWHGLYQSLAGADGVGVGCASASGLGGGASGVGAGAGAGGVGASHEFAANLVAGMCEGSVNPQEATAVLVPIAGEPPRGRTGGAGTGAGAETDSDDEVGTGVGGAGGAGAEAQYVQRRCIYTQDPALTYLDVAEMRSQRAFDDPPASDYAPTASTSTSTSTSHKTRPPPTSTETVTQTEYLGNHPHQQHYEKLHPELIVVNLDVTLQIVAEALLSRCDAIGKQLKTIFRLGDLNNDGVLSFAEFAPIVQRVNPAFHERKVLRMFREALMGGGDDEHIGPGQFLDVCKAYDLLNILDMAALRSGPLQAFEKFGKYEKFDNSPSLGRGEGGGKGGASVGVQTDFGGGQGEYGGRRRYEGEGDEEGEGEGEEEEGGEGERYGQRYGEEGQGYGGGYGGTEGASVAPQSLQEVEAARVARELVRRQREQAYRLSRPRLHPDPDPDPDPEAEAGSDADADASVVESVKGAGDVGVGLQISGMGAGMGAGDPIRDRNGDRDREVPPSGRVYSSLKRGPISQFRDSVSPSGLSGRSVAGAGEAGMGGAGQGQGQAKGQGQGQGQAKLQGRRQEHRYMEDSGESDEEEGVGQGKGCGQGQRQGLGQPQGQGMGHSQSTLQYDSPEKALVQSQSLSSLLAQSQAHIQAHTRGGGKANPDASQSSARSMLDKLKAKRDLRGST
ncbi:hypothetical protein B484DRAFT_415370 [Ochromonadaceae sp. CCMP2298]|nr:hypothetical protein B484DRAFT_415370 [Ochromonadaceae sp. CCMP2298]